VRSLRFRIQHVAHLADRIGDGDLPLSIAAQTAFTVAGDAVAAGALDVRFHWPASACSPWSHRRNTAGSSPVLPARLILPSAITFICCSMASLAFRQRFIGAIGLLRERRFRPRARVTVKNSFMVVSLDG